MKNRPGRRVARSQGDPARCRPERSGRPASDRAMKTMRIRMAGGAAAALVLLQRARPFQPASASLPVTEESDMRWLGGAVAVLAFAAAGVLATSDATAGKHVRLTGQPTMKSWKAESAPDEGSRGAPVRPVRRAVPSCRT